MTRVSGGVRGGRIVAEIKASGPEDQHLPGCRTSGVLLKQNSRTHLQTLENLGDHVLLALSLSAVDHLVALAIDISRVYVSHIRFVIIGAWTTSKRTLSFSGPPSTIALPST